MSLTYINSSTRKNDIHNDKRHQSLGYSDSDDYTNYDIKEYYSNNNVKPNNSTHNSTTSPSSKTDSCSLDSHKYNHNVVVSSLHEPNESENSTKYPLLTRKNTVIIHDSYDYESFFDALSRQMIQEKEEEEQKHEEKLENFKEQEKEEQKNLLCDNFTVKDLSNWLLLKKKTKFDNDYICSENSMNKLRDSKRMTVEQLNKQMHINKIKHYMTEYYKLLEEQNENNAFNPLRTIRDRELKLQTHHLNVNDNKVSETTKNFQKLMRNYQNVIKDPPTIPVLTFTKRYDSRARYNSDEKEKSHSKGLYNDNPSKKKTHSKNNMTDDSIDTSKSKNHHHYYYRLNYGSQSKKQPKYQYWKWFVGVNERCEDITIQKILHLKQDFTGKPQENSRLLVKSNHSNTKKESRTNSNDFSMIESMDIDNDGMDLEDDIDEEEEGEEENDESEAGDISTGYPTTKSCNEKFIQKIQETMDYLSIQEQGKCEKIVYLETIINILIQKAQRFQFENIKQLKKISEFEIPDTTCLKDLVEATKIEIPTCEKLTKISEDNDLANMGIRLTAIQSEISTTLQLRLKKITMNEDQTTVDESDEKKADGTFKSRRHGKNESKITTIGFYIIELTIKLILITIRILYGFYSFFTFSKTKNTSK